MKDKKNLLIIALVIIVILLTILVLLVLNKEEGDWVQNGNVITKGKESYNIGDVYEYDESNGGEFSNLTDVNWRVFGVENGNLLIMSASDVSDLTLGSANSPQEAGNDFLNGISDLNNIAGFYGKGDGALGARSINIDDLDKIMGYDKTKYGFDTINAYGNEVSYYWTDGEKPIYEDKSGNKGEVSNKHESFTWFDEGSNTFKVIEKVEATSENPVLIKKIKNTFYSYGNSVVYDKGNTPKNYSADSAEYKMLFSDENGNVANYWVASNFTNAYNIFVGYGFWVVKRDDVNYTYLVYSAGQSRESTFGVRAIVTID